VALVVTLVSKVSHKGTEDTKGKAYGAVGFTAETLEPSHFRTLRLLALMGLFYANGMAKTMRKISFFL